MATDAQAETAKRVFMCEVRRHEAYVRGLAGATALPVWHDNMAPAAKLKKLQSQLLDPRYDYLDDDPEQSRPSSRRIQQAEVWHRVADLASSLKCSSARYIRAYFLYLPPVPMTFVPDQLISAKAVQKFHDNLQRFRVDVEFSRKFDSETALAETEKRMASYGWSPLDAALSVLADDGVSLTPLFRFCLAVSEVRNETRYSPIVEKNYKPAALQVVYDVPTYREVWGSQWLPESFLSQVERIYQDTYRK